jgi:hypothetical protein
VGNARQSTGKSSAWSLSGGQESVEIAVGVLWAIGMVALLASTYIWYDYQNHAPRVPLADVGRIYRQSLRAVTVYLTKSEQNRLQIVESISFACIIGCFLVAGIMQWEQWRVDQKHYERPE